MVIRKTMITLTDGQYKKLSSFYEDSKHNSDAENNGLPDL